MKSLAWWRHEVIAFAVYIMMIFLMIVTRPFYDELKWTMLENRVFGWLEHGHVED
jgi:hypothetical protein